MPQVQTFISKKAISALSGKIDGDISFDKIHIKPFNALVIKNIAIVDRNPAIENADTLFKAEYVIARFSINGMFRKEGLHIGRAYVTNAEMTLVIEGSRHNNLTRIFRIPLPDRNKPRNENPVFDIRRASISDMTFRLKNIMETPYRYSGSGIDWSDLEVSDIIVEARKMRLAGQVMTGIVDFASFKEKSGYVCNSLSGKAKVGNGQTLIEEIRLSDPWSELYLPLYSMSYDDPLHFADYLNKILMQGEIENSSIDFKTLSYFAPGLEKTRMKSIVSGKVSGYVKDLNFKDMSIATQDGLELEFNGRLTGLPDIGKAGISLDLKNMKGTAAGIEAAIKSFSPDAELDIGNIAGNSEINVSGKASGTLNRLKTDMTVRLGQGHAHPVLEIGNLLSQKRSITIAGRIDTRDLDLGTILDSRMLGACTLRSSLKADLGNHGAGPELAIDSLFVDRLNFNGYDYSGIAAAGTMKKHAFDGRIVSTDPNLNFMFQGVFTLSPRTRNAVYKFYANLGYADLHALNFDKRGTSKASLKVSANFNRRRSGDLIGSMDITDIILENDAGKYDIGDIGMNSYFGDELYRMKMTSSFADASFAGSERITKFFSDLNNVTLKRELPALFRDTTAVRHRDRYRISFRNKNSMDLLAFVAPGLYISDSTAIDISIDTLGAFSARIESPRIAFNENYIRNMEMKMDNAGGSLGGRISGQTISIAGIALENNRFEMFAHDNYFGFGYTYENPGTFVNKGEVVVTGTVGRRDDGKTRFHVEMLPSRLLLNSREWKIEHSVFDINGRDLDVGKIEFTSGDQAVRLSGGYSASRQDTLKLRLERFDISIINPLLKNRFGIEGAATGEAGLISPKTNQGIVFGFLVDSTRIAGANIGTLEFGCEWNDGQKRFDAVVANEINGDGTFRIAGNYAPSSKALNASAELRKMDISYAEPFLKEVFSEMSGHMSGRITASGRLDDLHLYSENTRIDDSELRIAYTNVPYNVYGDFHLDDSGIYFDDITMHDRFGSSGKITGGIRYDRLKNMEMDTEINITGMECLATSEKDNSSFYGNLTASGSLSISGPFNALNMDIDAVTAGPGQLHIPIAASATATTGNLLTFKEEEKIEYTDPYELMIRKIKTDRKSPGEFGLKLNVEATPEVEAFIEIDKSSGNVLRGRGAGNIELEIGDGDFNILGDYTLTSGNYRFVAQGLAYRDFTISDGSSIKFNGDIMESDLNINATFRTKTSLSTLIADTSSVATRRTVDCGINISDKLKNPRLSFSIDIPDIDPTVKSRVESALSTEDKIQKQFLSLIVFNSFLPDDQSGIVNNASMLYSNVMGIMYNQLNNIFQKLDIPLDLSLNYQPNEQGQDIFDVAISTQLFNNRIVVNGNLGNQQYTSGNSNSSVVGDLDIEIKLDRPGLFRLNIFSHSADQYTNYLDDSQRNGIGLTYQQEFNTFREFFSNLFTSRKKKRAQAETAMEEASREKKTIIIHPDDNKRKKR